MTIEERIILRLCELVSMAETDKAYMKRRSFMPPDPRQEIRQFQEEMADRGDGHCTALVAAIAQTDLTVEEAARLASAREYERAAGFIRRSAPDIERERQMRLTRERIEAERGEEFCLHCGKPSDGSYCDSSCLEAHNAAEIEFFEWDAACWTIRHLA